MGNEEGPGKLLKNRLLGKGFGAFVLQVQSRACFCDAQSQVCELRLHVRLLHFETCLPSPLLFLLLIPGVQEFPRPAAEAGIYF